MHLPRIFMPCLFAALTTAVAFLSLTLGDLKPVIEFGKMMAVGMSFRPYIHVSAFLPAASCIQLIPGKLEDFINIKLAFSKQNSDF